MADLLTLAPKQVSLGGGSDLSVRRVLPQLHRSFVGAWCFVDHYGPDLAAACGGMNVAPHPHTGLQTVSWLFDGEIEHRDSAGVETLVKPGEVNLMTSGYGIAHSEVSTDRTVYLHGVQLWVVLPEADQSLEREFQHYRPDVVEWAGGTVRVLVGSFAGATSTIQTQTRLLGAEVVLNAGAAWEGPVDPSFEYGVLVDNGHVEVDGLLVDKHWMAIRDAGLDSLRLGNPSDQPVRLMLLGGKPFDESIIMWWNFIGRHHDDIERFRAEWIADADRFGQVRGWRASDRIMPPPLPQGRLTPRTRLGRH